MSLPTEPNRPSTLRAVIILFATAIAFLVAINVLAAFFLSRYPVNGGYAIVQAKWKLARAARPADWLILGDSSCNQGVRPDILTRKLGGNALNLCTIGDMLAADDAWILEQYLKNAPAPKAVVVVHVYDIWNRNTTKLRQAAWLVSNKTSFWRAQTPSLTFSRLEQLRLTAAPFVPLWFQNKSIKQLLLHPDQIIHPRTWHIDKTSGFMTETTSRPDNVIHDAASHLASITINGTKPELSKTNRRALARLCTLTMEHNISLWVIPSPLFSGLYEIPEFRAHYDVIQRLVAAELQHCPHLVHTKLVPQVFAADQMTNADHLIADAATTFSAWLTAELATTSYN